MRHYKWDVNNTLDGAGGYAINTFDDKYRKNEDVFYECRLRRSILK